MSEQPDQIRRTEPGFDSVEALLTAARAGLDRVTPAEAAAEVARGSWLVDIRPAWQRAREGEIDGALIVERNHLEWRLHPGSQSRLPVAVPGRRWIVVCSEGYTSSLAAAALQSLGIDATDLIGGVQAWRQDGLATTPTLTQDEHVVGAGPHVQAASVDRRDLAGPNIEDVAGH